MAGPTTQRQPLPRTAQARRVPSDRRPAGDTRRLAASTALASGNPLLGYGIAAMRAPARRVGRVSNLVFVAEIRRRIPEFVSNGHFPKQFGDFLDYLTSRKLSLETRVDGLGSRANYVVDRDSGRSVAAADVDQRLSVSGVARLFGVNFEKAAAEKYEKLSDEQKRAISIRRRNAGRLLDPSAGLPFQSWEDLTFSAPMLLDGEVSAFGGEAWVGARFAEASADPAENLRIVARARAEGVRIVPPARTREDAVAGRFVAGMPVLAAERSVRLRLVEGRLSHAGLSKAFGSNIFEHFEALARKAPKAASPTAAAASTADFMKRFGARRRREETGTARVHDRITILHEALDHGERMAVLHPDGSRESFDPRRLTAGRYRKEDPYGMPSGYVEIQDGGRAFAHLDDDGRLHNDIGAAVVSTDGSHVPDAYALGGRRMDEAAFRRASLPVPGSDPQDGQSARMSA